MSFMKFIKNHSRFLMHTLERLAHTYLPTACLLCGQVYRHRIINICTCCYQNLPALPPHCLRCGQFLIEIGSHRFCGQCLNKPPLFTHSHTLYPYVFPVSAMITQLKFQGQLSHAALFGHLLAEAVQQKWYRGTALPDQIIPIPLHPKRLAKRGFNQSLEIARPLSRYTGLAIDCRGLTRLRETPPQHTLPARQRRANLTRAFACQHRYDGQHLALLDDVMTTGHTVSEAVRTLLAAGARQVDVWCIARTIYKSD